MKSMQFRQLSKIALPIVKDCLILVLILVTHSLHVLPLVTVVDFNIFICFVVCLLLISSPLRHLKL